MSKREFVRTVTGDIPANKLGITYSHEHVMIDESFVTDKKADFLLNDVERITEELIDCRELGLNTLVDCMPANCGRNPSLIGKIAEKSNLNIIACTGLHQPQYYEPDSLFTRIDVEAATDFFIRDIEKGIEQSDYTTSTDKISNMKAGLLKFATNEGEFSDFEKQGIEAVVNSNKATGCPILTHTTNGEKAIEQVIELTKSNVDLQHVVLSHVDRKKDIAYQREVLSSGVSVEYDSIFRWKTGEKNWSLYFIEQLIEEFPNQIVVGMDAARNSYWKAYGGKPGMTYLLTRFKNQLAEMGLGKYFDNIFIKNPKRIFSFKTT